MTKTTMVNIGTPERPVLVPEKALQPDSNEGREWWGEVASGSVVLDEDALKLLLERKDNETK